MRQEFTEKLLRRLCGPVVAARVKRSVYTTHAAPRYVPPPRVNSSKGNALRNFLYFHANSLPFARGFFSLFLFFLRRPPRPRFPVFLVAGLCTLGLLLAHPL